MESSAAYKETGQAEEITWKDHSGNQYRDGYTVSEIRKRMKEHVVNRTVGMVVFEDAERVTIAHEARVDGDEVAYAYYTTIYKALIVSRKKLMEGAAWPKD